MEAETLERADTISVPTRNYRTYTDEQKAKILTTLDLNAGNLYRTSKETGVPISTLAIWRNGGVNENVTKMRNSKREALADRFEDLAHLYITQAEDTFEHSKGTQAITGSGIAVDKMRLLRGESTQNIAHSNDALSQLASKLLDYCQKFELDQEQRLKALNKFVQGAQLRTGVTIDVEAVKALPEVRKLLETQ